MNFSYDNIDGGVGVRSFRDLTGMPSENFRITKAVDDATFENKFIADIEKYTTKNYPMIAAAFISELGEGVKTKYGIRSGHMYTLIDTVNVKDPQNNDATVVLVKLRDPYGKDEYEGPWKRSDTDKWTDANKTAVGLDSEKNGVIFVPYEQFQECFFEYTVNYYQDWNVSGVKLRTQNRSENTTKYKLTSTADQDVMITFDWINPYFYPKTCIPTYPDLTITIADETNAKILRPTHTLRSHAVLRFPDGFKSADTWDLSIVDGQSDSNVELAIHVFAEKEMMTL